MTKRPRTLGLLAFLSALFLCTSAAAAVEAQDDFNRGVEFLRRNRKQEALVEFQKVLASDLSHEEAYQLWKDTDKEIWLELLVEGGEFELVAKHLMGLSRQGSLERRPDADAIKGHIRTILGDDVIERRRAVRTLAAEHGEYAVPYLLTHLANQDDDDPRIKSMHSLTEMDTDVVLPLIEALQSEDDFLRRNVALTLGRIGDPRAAGPLTWLASADSDPGVQAAAREGAERCGSSGDAVAHFLRDGDDYHHRRPNVLRPSEYSDVVWNWTDGALADTSVQRMLYNDELAKKAYYRALAVNPSSLDARAGIARAYVDAQAKLEAAAAGGLDVQDLSDRLATATVAINAAGVDALDLGLRWAVSDGDSSTGVVLCRALARLAQAPTPGLVASLRGEDGAMRAEAATAMGQIAYHARGPASSEAVAEMGRSAAREVLQIAAIIDADMDRAQAMGTTLASANILVNIWDTGATGLAMLHRVPGIDLILVADSLPDMTTAQVLDEVRRSDRYSETPILLLTADADSAADIYGDKIAGTAGSPADLGQVNVLLEGGLDSDRAQANALAEKAARALWRLADAGHTDLGQAVDALAGALATRPDPVVVPAMRALSSAGNASHVAALIAVLVDEARSEPARIAAARGVSGIVARDPGAVNSEQASAVHGVLTSDAPLGVREAASRAIGRMPLDPTDRASVLRSVRVDASADS